MKTLIFFVMCAAVMLHFGWRWARRPSRAYRSVDVLVPAYNEAPCLEATLRALVANLYVARVICIDDGSTDGTAALLDALERRWPDRLIALHQPNRGKGAALMAGLERVTAPVVFLTDADTLVPADDGLGHLLAEIGRGADAVGGIPSSNLAGAGLLPHIRASVKLPMIAVKRTFQQLLGGAPFIISGACGMFRTPVLRAVGLSDRTRVEDLDLTWTLVGRGYCVRQSCRCIVYPQECNSLVDEWRRWRRWIVGFAVCMRLHKRLLLTRFGLISILPMFALVLLGLTIYISSLARIAAGNAPHGALLMLFPALWLAAIALVGTVSAIHHRRPWLVPLSWLAVLYVILSYVQWLLHGLRGLVTGREPIRDKPTRYVPVGASHVVD